MVPLILGNLQICSHCRGLRRATCNWVVRTVQVGYKHPEPPSSVVDQEACAYGFGPLKPQNLNPKLRMTGVGGVNFTRFRQRSSLPAFL